MIEIKSLERVIRIISLLAVVSILLLLSGCGKMLKTGEMRVWTKSFNTTVNEFSSTDSNPCFILQPGYQLVFEEDDPQGEKLVISVLNETKIIDGIETRIVEERETVKGELKEISRNFFAISKKTNSVFYFGEEVDIYRDGKLAGHEGAWISGENDAKFGLMMPGTILLGARFYQEIAPGAAMDRAEIVEMGLTVRTEAGEFAECIKIEETTPLEPGIKEYKLYAPGVGLIVDGELRLVEYGYLEKD